MKTLEHFNQFVKEINKENGRIYKQSVLSKYSNDEVVKRYLQIAFDPFRVFGISTKKLEKRIVPKADILEEQNVFDLFKYLEEHNTGNFRDIEYCQRVLDYALATSTELFDLLFVLICKDLSIGCDAKTINKEIKDLIPVFSVQLANKYFDKPEVVEGNEFILTTKIDGGRIIALKEFGKVTFYTRAGHKYEGLVDLEREMSELMQDNMCLDGEITLLDKGTLTSKEQYKETMKIVRTKDSEKHGIKMLVFDFMSAESFKTQSCMDPYVVRRAKLQSIMDAVDFKYFEILPVLYQGTDTSMIDKVLKEQVEKGEEGIMINIANALYDFKRTNSLLKCKKFDSLDLEVVGVEEGSGRLTSMLGAIQVRYKDGNIVRVGSGFSDAERKRYWANPELILNRVVEIKYFEETTTADKTFSLRFPTWCSNIRTDKLIPDY